jgi:hypothetical protein
MGLLVAFFRAWLDERREVVDLATELGAKKAKLKQESEHTAQLRGEIASISERRESENKKELQKAISLLHQMKSKVAYWRDIVKDKWGMAPPEVKLLPDDWPTVVSAADKVSSKLRDQADALEDELIQVNGLITQFLNMEVNYRDQRLMPPAYDLLNRAMPLLLNITSELEAFEKAQRPRSQD